jgi:hypothetical protein
VDPESTGLNPVWRNSLTYVTLGTGWDDGANLTQIDAARQLLVQDMKILEGIAPESGAYLNEVRITHLSTSNSDLVFFSFSISNRMVTYRLRDTNSTGKNPSSAFTTISS